MVFNFVDSLDTFHAINVSSAAMYLVKKDEKFDIYRGNFLLYSNVYVSTNSPFEDIFSSANVYFKSDTKVDVVRSNDFFKNVILGNAYFNINLKVSLKEVSALSINNFELFALYMRNYNDSSGTGGGGGTGSGVDIDDFADSNTISRDLKDDGSIIFEINEDTMNLINSIVNRVSTTEFKNHLEDYSNPHRDKLINLIDTDIVNIKDNQVISYDGVKGKYINKDLPVDTLAGKVKMNADSDGKYLNEFLDNSTVIVSNGKLCAKKIIGQTVTVAEINTLAGMDTPIKPILESIASGRGFTGTVASKVELDAITDMRNGDMKIVTNDETNGNSKFTYIYFAQEKAWLPIGVADVNFRDFTVNKLDLETEVKGVLPQANIDLDGLVFLTDLENYMRKSIYDIDNDGIIDVAKTLYGLLSTTSQIDSAVNRAHNHSNIEFLNTLTAETIGNGVKLSDFVNSDSIIITKVDDKINIGISDKFLAKINSVSNKTDNKDFLTHVQDDKNPHAVTLKSLKDINFDGMIDQTALIYDGTSDKFVFKTVSSSGGKIKLNETSELKYLSEIIDNSTIIEENNYITAVKLKGQEVTVREINYLTGIDKPLKEMFNSISGVQKFTGVVNTKADLDLVTDMVNGDMKVVLADETHDNEPYKYVYSIDDNAWVSLGPNNVNIRDFETDKLDLTKEVTGILPQDNMNLVGIVKSTELVNYMKKSDYDINGNITVDAAETLVGLNKTASQINDSVDNTHNHDNIAVLREVSDVDGVLQYNGVPIASGAKLANSRNAGVIKANAKGAYDVSEVKIDPNTGFLYSEGTIKEVVPDLSICTATASYTSASSPAINIFKDTGIWGTPIDVGSKQPIMDINFGESLKFNSLTLLGTDKYGSINDIDVYIYNEATTQYELDISIKNAATHANNLVAYCLTKVYDVQKIRLVFRALNPNNSANRYELARVRLYFDKGFGTNPSMDYKNISMYESINDYDKLINTPKIDNVELTSSSNKAELNIASQTDLTETNILATHTNRTTLDKLSEDAEGNPLYNGNPISRGISDVSNEPNNAITVKDDGIWSKNYDADIASLRVRTNAGEKLTYCQIGLSAIQSSLAAGTIVKFDTLLSSNGIEINAANYSVKLKAGRTYRLIPTIGVGSPIGYVRYVIYNTTKAEIISPKSYFSFSTNMNDTWTTNNAMPTIYECTEDCEVVIKLDFVNGSTQIQALASIFTIEETVRQYYIEPAKELNETYGIEDTPIGHVISYMGLTAPKHYLVCDGSIYNIVDYPKFAEYIFNEYGSYNVWGGDGITTFAVPDMRGEFVRGYDSTALRDPDGSTRGIGKHQDATAQINAFSGGNWAFPKSTRTTKVDSEFGNSTNFGIQAAGSYTYTGNTRYTSRPTNVNTLFCIKCEPTYYMYNDKVVYGGLYSDLLFDGNVEFTTTSQVINLTKDFNDYTLLELHFKLYSNDTTITNRLISTKNITDKKIFLSYYQWNNVGGTYTLTFNTNTVSVSIGNWSGIQQPVLTKIYGLKTSDDYATTEEINAIIEEITGGDKTWLE